MQTGTKVLLGAAGLLGLGWLLASNSQSKPRFVGDEARVGDDVYAPVSSFPTGALPAVFPQGVGYVIQRVTGTMGDSLTGPIVAYALQDNIVAQLPQPTAPVVLPRRAVVTIMRNGSRVEG